MLTENETTVASKQTVYAEVRERLRSDILSGHLAPGSRLTIAPLTKRYGTSPTPIRAALQELQGQGLVITTPHQGARVRDIDEDYVANIYELRRAIAGILIPRVVRFICDDDIQILESIEMELESAIEDNDLPRHIDASRRFHYFLYSLARNEEALQAMDRTGPLLDVLRLKFGYGPSRPQDVIKTHRKFITALKRRNGAVALELFQTSNERALADLIEQVRKEHVERNKKG
ncbi:DNA-binding GntR family transcriptional regulator [Caballeronia udeis]|uniref:DNA-binding GntR family transcriptional regulator n=1 Tax=Caballeronia udeis TaxID=1232866 RepID=A0ABW8MYY8_9BURK